MRICGNPALNQVSAPCFQQHLFLSCLSHLDNSWNISNFFIIMFVMVICDQWSLMYYCNCFGAPQTTSIYKGKLTQWICVCCPTSQASPISSPLLGFPSPWDRTMLKLGQLITLKFSKCSTKRESQMSLTLKQKLEKIKLSQEAISKAEIG